MNCSDARPKLSDLLDGELSPRAASSILAHLTQCPDCRSDRALLAMIAKGVAALPEGRPSPKFDSRVLAAAAAARQARAPSHVTVWLMNAAASATVVWTAVLLAYVRPRLHTDTAWAMLRVLLHPQTAVSAAELRLVHAVASIPQLWRATRRIAEVLSQIQFTAGSVAVQLPFQLIGAGLIAGLFMMAATRRRPKFVASRRTR